MIPALSTQQPAAQGLGASLCLLAAALALFSGCSSTATYRRVPTTGRFHGEPRMVALAPNTFFFFQPKHDAKFSFTTHLKDDPALGAKGGRGTYHKAGWKIEPGEMITSGASVPRQLWLLPGFSAFDFTRAAIIHDWLYEAHHRYEMAKVGYAAARKEGRRRDMLDNERDMRWYGNYAEVTQDDAADIFAECLKVTMEESKGILGDFKRLEARAPKGHPDPANLDTLKDALHYSRPDPKTLWAYHYFVSKDCLIGTSSHVWNDHNSDVDIYRVLAGPEVRARARKRGYLSPWLIGRFQAILEQEKKRHEEYEKAKRTLGLAQNPPPPPPPKVPAPAVSAPAITTPPASAIPPAKAGRRTS